jgi:ATP-dependent exoDNAse (exonuclease V) alpha subunit
MPVNPRFGVVLKNDSGESGTPEEPEGEKVYTILQANGDTGVIESMEFGQEGLDSIDVRRDDGALLRVEPFKSDNGKYHTEIGDKGQRIRITDEEPTAWIKYLPVKRAWAVTTHKSQGLTITHPTRIVCEDFFRKPAMVYVACSRVKNPTDLTIVGAEYPVNGKPWLHWLCNADPAVSEWIGEIMSDKEDVDECVEGVT